MERNINHRCVLTNCIAGVFGTKLQCCWSGLYPNFKCSCINIPRRYCNRSRKYVVVVFFKFTLIAARVLYFIFSYGYVSTCKLCLFILTKCTILRTLNPYNIELLTFIHCSVFWRWWYRCFYMAIWNKYIAWAHTWCSAMFLGFDSCLVISSDVDAFLTSGELK